MKNLEIDINNVICVNLRKGDTNKRLSPTRIRFIADYFELSAEKLTELAERFSKVWIATKFEGGAAVIYGADAKFVYNFELFPPFDKLAREVRVAVLEIPVTFVPPTPVQTKKVKTPKVEVVKVVEVSDVVIEDLLEELDVDVILDKISAKGMASLTKRELDFLNNVSK